MGESGGEPGLDRRGNRIVLRLTATVSSKLVRDETLHQGASGFIEDASPEEDLGHRRIVGLAPRLKGGEEFGLIDQAALQCKQAEEEVMGCVAASGHSRVSRLSCGRRGAQIETLARHGAYDRRTDGPPFRLA